MFMNYRYMGTIIHVPQYFLIHVPRIYRYTNSLDTVISYIGIIVTWMLDTQLYHVHISLLHIFTGIHALIVSIFLSYGSPYILHVLLLHVSSCIPVTWLFPVIDIDILIIRYMSCWYAMCRIPHLLYIVSRYLVSWYQQSSCPIIVLLVLCTVLVLDILCSSYLYSVIPVINTVTPASSRTCVELSATRSKVSHHTYTW